MKRNYESIFVVEPKISEPEIDKLIEKFRELISKNGEIKNMEKIGLKKLTYKIKNYEQGYFVLLEFESEPGFVSELERNYRVTDSIIRYMTTSARNKKKEAGSL